MMVLNFVILGKNLEHYFTHNQSTLKKKRIILKLKNTLVDML